MADQKPDDSIPSSQIQLAPPRSGTASIFISEWPSGLPFDAGAVLQRNPELMQHTTIVLDLAYEEFCQRREAGEDVSADSFAERFPAVKRELLEQLAVEDFLHQNSDLLSDISDVRWPKVNTPFLNFELISELGKGAFSRVFLARDVELGHRLVVVKVCIHGGHEAQVLGRLNSPQVVPVFSVQEDEATRLTAICMPFLSRATLFDVVAGAFANKTVPQRSSVILSVIDHINQDAELTGPRFASSLTLRHGSYADGIAHIGRQLAEGLAFAHEKKISHCDIKPSNVLMTPGGGAMLLDFNLAAQHSSDRPIVGGTLPYMAPEQLRALVAGREDKDSVVGPRIDLFQLGVTLFESLSGKLPFGPLPQLTSNKQIAEKILARQQEGPEKLRKLNPDVNAQLARIIERCLAFDPADRPASAAELAAQLHAYLAPLRMSRRWIKRHRLMLTGVLLASTVGIGTALASREPYLVRQYKQGVAANEGQNYAEAITRLSNVLKEHPNDLDALVARGHAYMKSDEPQFAFTDFKKAASQSKDGRVTACFAYAICKVKGGSVQDALHLFELARQRGFDSAIVLNDIGWCQLRLKNPLEAEKAFQAAIAHDSSLQAAFYQMALLDSTNANRDQRAPDTRYIERAIEMGSWLLMNDNAVGMYVNAARLNPHLNDGERRELRRKAIDCCERGVRQGMNRQALETIASLYPEIGATPRFQDLLASSKIGKSNVENPPSLLLDPLDAVRTISIRAEARR